jgi:FMN reductase
MHVLLIAASPSATSRSAALLDAAGVALERSGVRVRRLSLRELPAEALLRARVTDSKLGLALAQVADAGAVVLATPIYKAAYSGLLKVFLDLLPQDGLHGKWVWPLATGGSPAHTLALDHSLRPVLDNLGAHQVVPAVYALDAQIALQRDGHAALVDAAIQGRLQAGVERLAQALDAQCHWHERAQTHEGLAITPALFGAARCSA